MEEKEKILNPFALPPETNARFNILLLSVIVLSFILGSNIPLYFLSAEDTSNIISPKVDYSNTGIDSVEDLRNSGLYMISNSLEYLPSIIILFFILLTSVFISTWIYKRHAREIIIKKNLKRIDVSNEQKYFKAKKEIQMLSDIYGIKTPEIYIAPGFSTGAQAFGFKNKSMLRIDSGLRMMSGKNYNRFKSILLHEMGHIVNEDVSKTYLSKSLWKTVLYFFAVPTLLIITFSFAANIFNRISNGIAADDLREIFLRSIPTVLIFSISILSLFLLIYFILKSIVRTREYYADWRAASAGMKEDLAQLFKENLVKEKRLNKFFSWHPPLASRIKILEDPSGLFFLNKDICFIVGILIPLCLFLFFTLGKIGLTITGLISGASQIISQDITLNIISVILSIIMFVIVCFIPFFITSYLISSSLGLQIQRNVIVSFSDNKPVFGFKEILISTLIITLGMIAGSLLIPYYSILNQIIDTSLMEFLKEKIPVIILSFILAFTVIFLWIFYIKFFTKYVYGRYVKTKPPKTRYILFNFGSAVLLSLMLLPVAGVFFRIYTNEIGYLNEVVNTLLLIVPVLYVIIFLLTGLVLGIVNSLSSNCPHCKKVLPAGNLIGKECANCNSMFSEWLYLKM